MAIHVFEAPPKAGTKPRKGYKPGLSKALVGIQPNGQPFNVPYITACTSDWKKANPELGFLTVVEIDRDLTDEERATWRPPLNAPTLEF